MQKQITPELKLPSNLGKGMCFPGPDVDRNGAQSCLTERKCRAEVALKILPDCQALFPSKQQKLGCPRGMAGPLPAAGTHCMGERSAYPESDSRNEC